MLASLRRIYYYFIAVAALILLTSALQGFLYQLSIRAGIRDVPFTNNTPQSFSQSTAFLVVALVIVLPVGALHWWLIRRDASQEPAALGGVVREIFLDLITIVVATVTIVSGAYLAYALFANDSNAEFLPGIASPLATTVAWCLALTGLVLERRQTPPLAGVARGISMILAYVQQIGLLIALMILGSTALQQILDVNIHALPSCMTDLSDSFFSDTNCQLIPDSVGGTVAASAVVLFGLAGFMIWTRRDGGSVYRQLGDVVLLITATITTLVGLNQVFELLLHLIAGQPVPLPQALVDTSFGPTYRMTPLVPGGLAIAFFLIRAFRTRIVGPHAQQMRQIALVAVNIPFAVTFLSGTITVVDGVFQQLRDHPNSVETWLQGWGLLLAGVAWLGLWPLLARVSDPRRGGPEVPRRVYTFVLLGGTVLGTVIGVVVGLYAMLTKFTGAPVDPSGDITTAAFATALVLGVTAAYYFFVLQRDQRLVGKHASTTPQEENAITSTTTIAATLEDVLHQVVTGQLGISQAVDVLQKQFGAHNPA
jgi:hypothetical protein